MFTHRNPVLLKRILDFHHDTSIWWLLFKSNGGGGGEEIGRAETRTQTLLLHAVMTTHTFKDRRELTAGGGSFGAISGFSVSSLHYF